MTSVQVQDVVKNLPAATVLREALSENLREGRTLRELLRIAERRERSRHGAADRDGEHTLLS
jgi:hypothetical protein